jgi:hypothetical protein
MGIDEKKDRLGGEREVDKGSLRYDYDGRERKR